MTATEQESVARMLRMLLGRSVFLCGTCAAAATKGRRYKSKFFSGQCLTLSCDEHVDDSEGWGDFDEHGTAREVNEFLRANDNKAGAVPT